MIADFRNKSVLIIEGTSGIGLEVALAFARRGAACILTHDATASSQRAQESFQALGTLPPHFVATSGSANGSAAGGLDTLLQQLSAGQLSAGQPRLEALIIAPPAIKAPPIHQISDYSKHDLTARLEKGVWPMIEHTQRIHDLCGYYPRYVVGLAGTSAGEYSPGADFEAASTAAMETLCRYMNYHLFDEDIRVNVLRYRNVKDHSPKSSAQQSNDSSGMRQLQPEYYDVPAAEVGNAAVALCSGLMDCMSGHILTVDRGTSFYDNLMRLYSEREHYQLGDALVE